ncbi:unnamed protein product, partial [Amoebophrya sp. A25]
ETIRKEQDRIAALWEIYSEAANWTLYNDSLEKLREYAELAVDYERLVNATERTMRRWEDLLDEVMQNATEARIEFQQ